MNKQELAEQIAIAKKSYKTNTYKSYRECFEAGIAAIVEAMDAPAKELYHIGDRPEINWHGGVSEKDMHQHYEDLAAWEAKRSQLSLAPAKEVEAIRPEKALSELWKQKQSEWIDKHIIPMYATLRAQSIKYFLKDGTVSGSFRQALEDIMNDVRKFCNPQPAKEAMDAPAKEVDFDLKQEAQESWERINARFENGVNPYAYVLGYKNAALKYRQPVKEVEAISDSEVRDEKLHIAKLQAAYAIEQGHGLEAAVHFREGYLAAKEAISEREEGIKGLIMKKLFDFANKHELEILVQHAIEFSDDLYKWLSVLTKPAKEAMTDEKYQQDLESLYQALLDDTEQKKAANEAISVPAQPNWKERFYDWEKEASRTEGVSLEDITNWFEHNVLAAQPLQPSLEEKKEDLVVSDINTDVSSVASHSCTDSNSIEQRYNQLVEVFEGLLVEQFAICELRDIYRKKAGLPLKCIE